MSFVVKIIRVLILVLSFYGYIQSVRKKVKLEFSIGIIFSAIGSVMFLAGILNIMKEAAILICLCGLVLAIQSIYKREKMQGIICIGTIFFLVICVFFVFLLYGNKFLDYDNFSHWALVEKTLLSKNRFPNFMDSNIMFQSYPPGSASYIYYVCKITGIHSEWMQMYAQTTLMSGILISLFAFSNKWQNKLLMCVGSVILLAGNTRLDSLLVDSLLAITALGGMAFCIYYRNSLHCKLEFILPYVIFLIAIKNSGIFFAIVILIYALLHIKKNKKSFGKWISVLSGSFVPLILWQKHVKLVFDNGLMAKHSMSLSNFETVFGEKGWEDIIAISSKFFRNIFSFSNAIIYIFLFMLLLWIAIKRSGTKEENKKRLKNIYFTIVFSYITYQISLFGMYLFTMPLSEALDLAAYSRYHDTILVFVSGILLIGVSLVSNSLLLHNRGINLLIVNTLCLICIYLGVNCKLEYYQKRDFNNTVREKYDKIIAEYNIQPQKRYLLITKTDVNGGYLYYLSKYLLDPSMVTVLQAEELEEYAIAENYDYVIGWNREKQIEEYIEKIDEEQVNVQGIMAEK